MAESTRCEIYLDKLEWDSRLLESDAVHLDKKLQFMNGMVLCLLLLRVICAMNGVLNMVVHIADGG